MGVWAAPPPLGTFFGCHSFTSMPSQLGEQQVIHVGPHPESRTMKFVLAGSGFYVVDKPHNPQGAGWSDTFSVKVEGNELTVQRTDSRKGWGQDLELMAIPGLDVYTIHPVRDPPQRGL